MAQLVQLFQRNHLLLAERPDREATQRHDMAERAEPPPHVARQRPHIGTLAAFGEERSMVRVRALARDMGRRLGCYGHVVALRRLAVGPFDEAHMIPLEKAEELRHNAGASDGAFAAEALHSVETALDGIPALAMTEPDAARLRRGQAVILKGRDAPVMSGPAYAVFGGQPVALGEVDKGAFNPRRVFNLSDGRSRPGNEIQRMTDVDHR